MRFLVAAGGPGSVGGGAAARGAAVVGIDFSAEMVARARSLHRELRIEEGDAERLNLPDEAFDAAAMNFGMLHLANPEHAIAEAFRVLRPGGRYAFTVWDLPERALAFQIVLESVQAHGEMDVGLPPGPPFFRFSDPAECARTLAEAGFRDVRSAVVPQIWLMDSADTLFDTMRGAAVRTAALLNAQTDEARRAIRRQIAEQAERHRRGGRIELPMPAVLTVAKKDGNAGGTPAFPGRRNVSSIAPSP
jgi:SAM-dependent methyltransferase